MVSNIFHVQPYLGKIPILTNIFQTGWNHQLVDLQESASQMQWPLYLTTILHVMCVLFVENSFQIVATICFHRHLRRNMNIHFQISNPSRGRKARLVVFGATWGFGCAVVGRLLTKESGIFLHDANPRFWILSFGKVPLEFICSHVPTYIYIYIFIVIHI